MARRTTGRWSARFTAYAKLAPRGTEPLDVGFDAVDRALRAAAARASAVQFCWRYDGQGRANTFALPAGLEGAAAYRLDLLRAVLESWPADEDGRPVDPAGVARAVWAGTDLSPVIGLSHRGASRASAEEGAGPASVRELRPGVDSAGHGLPPRRPGHLGLFEQSCRPHRRLR